MEMLRRFRPSACHGHRVPRGHPPVLAWCQHNRGAIGQPLGVATGGGRSLILTIAALVAAGSAVAPMRTASAVPAPATTIQVEQNALVNRTDGIPIQATQRLIAAYQANVWRDRQAMAGDAAAEQEAADAHQAASSRLAGDTQDLNGAQSSLQSDRWRVEVDKSRLRAIAIGTYTGQLTNPQPAGSQTPVADQQAAIDVTEVTLVSRIVERHLRADLDSVVADTRRRDQLAASVTQDQQQLSDAAQAQTTAVAKQQSDNYALLADQRSLSSADVVLGRAQAKLISDLASVAGPASTPVGTLSLLGGSAMTAAQLAAWYHWEGYFDLTSVPIEQLAGWYVQAGGQEGVRGDVAFAQAILETGGFSSPDAVNQNNYAGIGHCDSCASGWQFPSPNGGVVGQLQLLRIFATTAPSPPGAPGPVLPSLTASQQHEAGCCPSVESLTGVWATDPTYGSQILGIYKSMLDFALGSR